MTVHPEVRAHFFRAHPLPAHHDPNPLPCSAFRHWLERQRLALSCSRCGELLVEVGSRSAGRLVDQLADAERVITSTEALDAPEGEDRR